MHQNVAQANARTCHPGSKSVTLSALPGDPPRRPENRQQYGSRHMAIENIVNRLSEQLGQVLPPGVKALRHDMEDNIKSVLREAFARMELVTREEFDIQATLLSKTRIRLEALEARLKALEAQVSELEGNKN